MSPDDPRHGQNRGYIAGCRDACCRAAHAKHHKDQRTRMYLAKVDRLHTSGLGTRRRIQALMALGWSSRELDKFLGKRPSYTYRILTGKGEVYLTTARRFADLYDRLSMTKPPVRNEVEAAIVRRNINMAARRGYAPPLAWDDIDNPDEQPADWHYQPGDRGDLLEELDARKVGISEVCRVLGLRRDTVEKWCERNGYSSLFSRLVARETSPKHQFHGNQHQKVS